MKPMTRKGKSISSLFFFQEMLQSDKGKDDVIHQLSKYHDFLWQRREKRWRLLVQIGNETYKSFLIRAVNEGRSNNDDIHLSHSTMTAYHIRQRATSASNVYSFFEAFQTSISFPPMHPFPQNKLQSNLHQINWKQSVVLFFFLHKCSTYQWSNIFLSNKMYSAYLNECTLLNNGSTLGKIWWSTWHMIGAHDLAQDETVNRDQWRKGSKAMTLFSGSYVTRIQQRTLSVKYTYVSKTFRHLGVSTWLTWSEKNVLNNTVPVISTN